MTPTFLRLDAGTGWSVHPDRLAGGTRPGRRLLVAGARPVRAATGAAPLAGLARLVTCDPHLVAGRAAPGCACSVPATRRSPRAAVRRPVRAVAARGGLVAALLGHSRGTVLILDAATGHQVGEARVRSAVGLVALRR